MKRVLRPSAMTIGTVSVSAAVCVALVGGVAAPASAAGLPTVASATSSGPSATPGPVPPIVPVVASMNRHIGNTASVRVATLRGTHLGHISQVLIGGVAAPDLTVVNSKRVTFLLGTAPDFQAAIVPVSIVTDTGATMPTTVSYEWRVRTRRDREMAYAGTHWNVTKSARYGFLPGSDCTNFVSQLLQARGWKQSAQWWNTWSTTRTWSATWASVTAMSDWLGTRPDLATHLTYAERDQAVVGDIVQINWDGVGGKHVWEHSAVVSKVVVNPDGTHDVYYTAHTTARLYGGSLYWIVKGYKHVRIQFWHLLK